MKKITIYIYIFLRIIDINDRFNVRRIISYYNVKHIKDKIYEAEANGNNIMVGDFETMHPNNREFRCYDIARTLNKQYVLACNHSFVKSGQCIIFF